MYYNIEERREEDIYRDRRNEKTKVETSKSIGHYLKLEDVLQDIATVAQLVEHPASHANGSGFKPQRVTFEN